MISPVREARERIEMGQAHAATVRFQTMADKHAQFIERSSAAIREQAAKVREGHIDTYA